MSADGVLTLRIVRTAQTFVGNPTWFLPQWNDTNRNGIGYALNRFERKNVRLPVSAHGPTLIIESNCAPACIGGVYCNATLASTSINTVDSTCASGYNQTAYDQCCQVTNRTNCVFASRELM
jgi:hypothetical protein